MNQYPVLFITLKDAEGLNFQGAYGMLRSIISDLCVKHSYLGRSEKADSDDAERFKKLKAKTASDDEI